MSKSTTWHQIREIADVCLHRPIGSFGAVTTSRKPGSTFFRYRICDGTRPVSGLLASQIYRPIDFDTFCELVVWGDDGGRPTYRLTEKTITVESTHIPDIDKPRLKYRWTCSGSNVAQLDFLLIEFGAQEYVTYHPLGTQHRYLYCTERTVDLVPERVDHDMKFRGHVVPQFIQFESMSQEVLTCSRLIELTIG